MVLASCPPTLDADYHGPGSDPDAGLVPQLVWQACLSSHLESRQLTAHHLVQHYAAGSFPGKDCELLIACLTIDTHTYTGKCETQAHMLGKLYQHPEQPFQIWSKLPTRRHDHSQKLVMLLTMCPQILIRLISLWSGRSIHPSSERWCTH